MNDRSVRMVMFGALLAALVACGSNSQPAEPQSEATGTQFASADDLGKWLSSNGFGCTRDDRLGGVYMCTYAGEPTRGNSSTPARKLARNVWPGVSLA